MNIKTNYKIITALIFASVLCLNAQILLRDDFSKPGNYWFNRNDGNQSIPEVKNGFLQLTLLNAISTEYCNTEIYDPIEPYKQGTILRVRLKCTPQHIGSRGWGFWDGDFTLNDVLNENDFAWVMQQKSERTENNYNWFQFGIGQDSIKKIQSINLQNVIDETQWHTYKIVLQNNLATFFVDDLLYFSSNKYIPDDNMRFDVWIDNRVLNIEAPIDFWNNNSEGSLIYVDFVEISGLNGTKIQRNQFNNILMWESPNTFPNGDTESLWKEYNFTLSNSGEVLFYLTGNAENLSELRNDDDLKIIVDDVDFGWNTVNSLNGENLKGSGYSISLPLNLSAGNHNLKIYTDGTPFISDVLILNSQNSKTVFNRNYLEEADENDGLFKDIVFNVNENSEITSLLSFEMSYNEDIKITVDDNEVDLSDQKIIAKNEFYTRPVTFVFNKILTVGNHSLKIYKYGLPKLMNVTIYGISTITDINRENGNNNLNYQFGIYPNPFNSSTKINYTVPFIEGNKNLPVKLKIYDVLGNELSELMNEFQNPGNYEVNFNAENLASGIYYCKILINNYIETKKILLLK